MLNHGATSSRNSLSLRLDPFSLPARYTARLAGAQAADEASIYLDRNMAIVKRRLSGLPLTVCTPVHAFRGIAVRSTPVDDGASVTVSIELLHNDPALSLPLLVTDSYDDVVADWQAWSRALGLPLILVEPDGSLAEPVSQVGSLRFDGIVPRRRRAMTGRRPRFMGRRKPGRTGNGNVRYVEREIIART